MLVLSSNDNTNDFFFLQENIEKAISENDQAVSGVEVIMRQNDDDVALKFTTASHLLIHA